MNEAQLTQFTIPTESKTAATSFLRANPNVAREFANSFGVTDVDDRVALRAAQMAAVAIFEDVDDVAGAIGPKIEQYRTYIKNAIPASVAPVTVTTVEVVAEPEVVEIVEVSTLEAPPEVIEIAEPEVVEAPVEAAAEVSAEPEPEVTAEPEVAAEPAVVKAKGTGRGKKAYALTGKVTAYQKCVNWLSDNGITTTDDRSALALKLTEGTGVPVGSCLVYISTAFKAGLLTK